jgi:phosphoribosylaminoimidazolecarboxamide formyltransferase / IMP cyclohydrolase
MYYSRSKAGVVVLCCQTVCLPALLGSIDSIRSVGKLTFPSIHPPNPQVHGGLLGVRGNAAHEQQMLENGIACIDLVVLNLYAFEHTVAKGGDFATCIENIDIGGPSMLRSSAKNHNYVVIATSPSQYGELMEELKANSGSTSLALRKRFAARAFATSAAYDSAIAGWINGQLGTDAPVVRGWRP